VDGTTHHQAGEIDGMDAINGHPGGKGRIMTTTERAAQRSQRLDDLRNRIVSILKEHGPLNRTKIERQLQADQVETEDFAFEDPFEIRAVVSKLIREGTAIETTDRDIKLDDNLEHNPS
jgi:hypothetical protein